MRNFFIEYLLKESKKKHFYLLTSDLGFNSFEKFRDAYPKRFINVGISENNMVGVAAGLALKKNKVFIYSILPFLIFRSLEQIRNNLCHNKLDVTLVCGGGGFSYGYQGISHNTTEDISIIRSLPDINVFNPGSLYELNASLKKIFKNNKTNFIRLGKNYECNPIEILKKNLVKYTEGNNVTIFSTGNILSTVIEAVNELKKYNVNCKVISIFCLKPIDKNYIIKNIKTKLVITIEENINTGGLGSIISNVISEKNIKNINFKQISLKDKSHKKIGSQDYLRKINGLDKNSLIKKIKEIYKNA
jgi:transketolase